MKRGSSAKFQKLGGAMAPAGPPPAPPLDITVGVGGDGGISDDGRIYPNVGGYFAIIEQVQ